MIVIKDRFGDYRGYITEGGECVNNRDRTIGFINEEDGTAGSFEEEYLGQIQDQVGCANSGGLCCVGVVVWCGIVSCGIVWRSHV